MCFLVYVPLQCFIVHLGFDTTSVSQLERCQTVRSDRGKIEADGHMIVCLCNLTQYHVCFIICLGFDTTSISQLGAQLFEWMEELEELGQYNSDSLSVGNVPDCVFTQ